MMPPPITTTSAEAGGVGEVWMWCSGEDRMHSPVDSSLDALDHVELRHAIAAFPSDRRAPGHEKRIAGAHRQHAAIRGGKSHAAGQEMHELVEAMRTDDPVVRCRIPGASEVLRGVVGEYVVAAALRGRTQEHLRRQRCGRLEVGV